MGLKKQLENISADLIKSFEFVPKFILVAFWLSGFAKLMEYDDGSKYLLLISFFIMTLLMFNYVCKNGALRIREYADKKYVNHR